MKRRGLHGITLFLAIGASVVLACVSVLLMAGEYQSARFDMDTHVREYQGWQAFRQTNPAYYEDNKEAVSACMKSLEAAQDNFWLQRSKAELVGMFIIAGLGSAIGGYLAIWALVGVIGIGLQKVVKRLSLRSPPKQRRPLDSPPPLQSNISPEYR